MSWRIERYIQCNHCSLEMRTDARKCKDAEAEMRGLGWKITNEVATCPTCYATVTHPALIAKGREVGHGGSRPPEYYEGILKRFREGETLQSIADSIGITRQAVHVSLKKYLKRTGQELDLSGRFACPRCHFRRSDLPRRICQPCLAKRGKGRHSRAGVPDGCLCGTDAAHYMGYRVIAGVFALVRSGVLEPAGKAGHLTYFRVSDLDRLMEAGYGERGYGPNKRALLEALK